jgi:hypothetical protein
MANAVEEEVEGAAGLFYVSDVVMLLSVIAACERCRASKTS